MPPRMRRATEGSSSEELFNEPEVSSLTYLMLARLSVEDLPRAGADYARQRKQTSGFLDAALRALNASDSQASEPTPSSRPRAKAAPASSPPWTIPQDR